MINNIKNKARKIPSHVWVLMAIVLIGIFLRTYHFRDWLNFRDDQARDAYLAGQVIEGKNDWPSTGAYMSFTGQGAHDEIGSFHLGPLYYDFQIIAGKIFGDGPEVFAYPDVFFAILSIPLLYLFLGIYFKKNISLGVTSVYAISSYFVQYARFAWNTNLIPFFVLLFLFSLYKFLEKKEKTSIWWVILLGAAVGTGIQLHATLIVLFLSVTFFVFLFMMKKNPETWKKWMLVFFVICFLNTAQIINEIKTNFSNTKIFFSSASSKDQGGNDDLLSLVRNDFDCNIESNAFFLSSFGDNNCAYIFSKTPNYKKLEFLNHGSVLNIAMGWFAIVAVLLSFVFGYFLFFRQCFVENEKNKKLFLRLILLYSSVAFLMMIPLSKDSFKDFRYLTPTFFMPFLLLGFLVKYICEISLNVYVKIIFIGFIFSILFYSNIKTTFNQVAPLISKNKTCASHWTALGELEPVAEYMISNANGKKLIYFGGDETYQALYEPLEYLLKKRGVNSIKIGDSLSKLTENDGPTYFIKCSDGLKKRYGSYGKIDNLFVFQVRQ